MMLIRGQKMHVQTTHQAVAGTAPADDSMSQLSGSGRSKFGNIALALGNEGAGVSSEIDAMSRAIAIPMPGEMESLNVSQAGAILLHSLSTSFPAFLDRLHVLAEGG